MSSVLLFSLLEVFALFFFFLLLSFFFSPIRDDVSKACGFHYKQEKVEI